MAWSIVRGPKKRDLDIASENCYRALELTPNLCEAFGCLGVIAYEQGRLREAETLLERSVSSKTRDGRYTDLASLYVQLGRFEDAEPAIQEGLAFVPDDARLHLELANVYLNTAKIKNAKEARRASGLEPQSVEAIKVLAVSLMEDDNFADAERVLRIAIRGLDSQKRWRLQLALCRLLTDLGDQTSNDALYADAL